MDVSVNTACMSFSALLLRQDLKYASFQHSCSYQGTKGGRLVWSLPSMPCFTTEGNPVCLWFKGHSSHWLRALSDAMTVRYWSQDVTAARAVPQSGDSAHTPKGSPADPLSCWFGHILPLCFRIKTGSKNCVSSRRKGRTLRLFFDFFCAGPDLSSAIYSHKSLLC